MKKLIVPLICLAVLVANVARGDSVPFFSALRGEITNQLALVCHTVPENKTLGASLRSNLKLIDKTKTNFIAGSTALGILAKSLGKTTLSNTFLPILIDIRAVYLEAMETETSALENRLAATMPGTPHATAQKMLGKLSAALEGAGTNLNFPRSLRSLSQAATSLSSAHKLVAKAETAKPGSDFLLATIIEPNLGTNLFKPSKGLLDATYDPLTGDLNVEFGILKKLVGSRTLARFLSLSAIVPGSGSYTLSLTNDNEGYALYQSAIVLNITAEEPEVESEDLYLTIEPFNRRLGAGSMTIKVDLARKVVWGSFQFTALHTENLNLEVSVAGTFLVRLYIFEDDFE